MTREKVAFSCIKLKDFNNSSIIYNLDVCFLPPWKRGSGSSLGYLDSEVLASFHTAFFDTPLGRVLSIPQW
jgi:hypothetical protein